jgi:hypothetical protein
LNSWEVGSRMQSSKTLGTKEGREEIKLMILP